MNFFRKALHNTTLFLIFFSTWLMWPWDMDSNVLNADGAASVPDYRMRQSRYVSVREGKKDLEFYSDHSTFDFIERLMNAEQVTLYFYDTEEQKTKVTAASGKFDMTKKHFFLQGNVESESPDGFFLKSESANYRMSDRVMFVPQALEGFSKDQNMKIWSDRGESSIATNIIKLFGNVKTHYNDPKKGLTKIRANFADLKRNESVADYRDHVEIEQKEIRVTGNNASLYYTKGPDAVKYMSVSDEVKILEKDGRYTRSQVAEFFAPTDSIVLTGFPSLYDGDDAVTGDKITLYRTTGVVEVTATNAAARENTLMTTGKKAGVPVRETSEDDELIP